VQRVRSNCEIKCRGDRLFPSEFLIGELIGIAETGTGGRLVCFCGRDLAVIDRNTITIRRRPPQLVDLMDNATALHTTSQASKRHSKKARQNQSPKLQPMSPIAQWVRVNEQSRSPSIDVTASLLVVA